MEIVKWGIVVTGILLLRKAAWGRISRRMQYGIWIVAVLLFMVQPFIPVQSRFSIDNLFSESIIFREQNGRSINTDITGSAPVKADSEAQETALMGQDREETQVPLQGGTYGNRYYHAINSPFSVSMDSYLWKCHPLGCITVAGIGNAFVQSAVLQILPERTNLL